MEAGLDNFGGEMAQDVVIRRPGKGHDPAVVSGDRRLVEADVSKIGAQLTVAIKRFILLQEANAVLRHKNPARLQAALAAFVKRRGKQRRAGADRVGTVRDNDIKRLRGLVNKIDAIVDNQIKPRIVIAAGIVVGQILAAERHHTGVDFHHGDGFDILMTRDFTQHRAVAAADNQHVLRVAVGQQRDVGHHFVIDKLVALGGLHHAVQRHYAAKGGVFEDYQILMIGFLMIEHVIHGKILTKLVMQRFLPYRFFGHGEHLLR